MLPIEEFEPENHPGANDRALLLALINHLNEQLMRIDERLCDNEDKIQDLDNREITISYAR